MSIEPDPLPASNVDPEPGSLISAARQRRSLKESRQVPYFLAHVIVTTIMVLVFILILKADAFKVLSILIPIVLIVWLVGFLNSTLRLTISADTTGPPVDHRLWLVLKRFQRKRCVRELEAAIQAGQYAIEPQGTRLEEI